MDNPMKNPETSGAGDSPLPLNERQQTPVNVPPGGMLVPGGIQKLSKQAMQEIRAVETAHRRMGERQVAQVQGISPELLKEAQKREEPERGVDIPIPPPEVQIQEVETAEREVAAEEQVLGETFQEVTEPEPVVLPQPEDEEFVGPVMAPRQQIESVVVDQIHGVRQFWGRNRYKFLRTVLAENKMFKFSHYPDEMLMEIKAGAEDTLADDQKMAELIRFLNSLKTSSDSRRKMKMLQFLLVADSILRIVKRGGYRDPR